ncbi:xanthine dehydrogenase family protein molybdopterin-binding subunit [Roseiterribacter gracilis]|uniref:Oxidoreductase n=1 Tax=Roseiterribacter gracilis TaxID=2812848 RepID=A0A8S8X791_9PROT|nr:oxidoreductase [Rhodospirillales bacterium TMPK1]
MKLTNDTVGRRGFLAGSAAASLVIAFNLTPHGARAAAAATNAKNFAPNAFLRVAPDGTVTVLSKHLEMGQGSYTGIATIVAEELDADWSKVRCEGAPADAKLYSNHLFGMQGTGGSSSIANSWDELRTAGATARAMLIQAAAAAWKVPAGEIETSKSTLRHAASNRTAPYAQFVSAAAALPVPAGVKLKDPATYTLIGKSAPRLDSNAKTDGTAQFTLDVYLPGMVTALVARSPKFGGTVKSVDAAAAKKIKGVLEIVQIPSGVAVVAKDTWAAKQGRDALNVTWDFANAETRSTTTIVADYKKLAQQPGAVAAKKGDAAQALASAAKRVEATYVFPYLAHAPMEPLDTVVKLGPDSCEIWAGDQFQTIDQGNVAKLLGFKPEQIKINTLYAGGSFGRRANTQSDFIVEAVAVAKAMKQKAPVKVVWTREDDIRGGLYRPLFVHKMEAGIDAQGNLTAWTNRLVGQSILVGTPFESMMVKDGVDMTSVEGSADMPYDVANILVDTHNAKAGVPVLWWRSVGHTHTAFAVETFLDDVAKAAGKDPFELRRSLMTDTKHTRLKTVLELAADKAGWSKPLAAGPAGVLRGRGIAAAESFSTYVAQVAEVSVKPDGSIKVDRVVVAVDCGVAVNPDVIKAQMEGGVGFGLGALLHGEITLKDGEVEQSNFHDYVPLRMDEMPKVEVFIVPSTAAPTGVGEPGVPPIGPAVANAIFAATGKRVRELPLTQEKLKAAIASA